MPMEASDRSILVELSDGRRGSVVDEATTPWARGADPLANEYGATGDWRATLDAQLAAHFARQHARISQLFTEQMRFNYVILLVQAALVVFLALR